MICPRPFRSHLTPALVYAAVLLIMLTARTRAGADNATKARSIFDAARAAVDSRRTESSKVLGINDARRAFSDVPPQGAILVGFDLGVGPDGNIELIWALRPVFHTARGEVIGAERGMFYDRNKLEGKRIRIIKSRVKRTVHLRAPAGYAVGGVTVRTGLNINGMCVKYMKIEGGGAEPDAIRHQRLGGGPNRWQRAKPGRPGSAGARAGRMQ